MKIQDIKIGMHCKIVGTSGGCGGDKCKDCFSDKDTVLEIKEIYPDSIEIQDARKIHCLVIKGNGYGGGCTFHHEDLEEIKISNWKERITK